MFARRKIMKSGIKVVNFKSPYTCIFIYLDSNPVHFPTVFGGRGWPNGNTYKWSEIYFFHSSGSWKPKMEAPAGSAPSWGLAPWLCSPSVLTCLPSVCVCVPTSSPLKGIGQIRWGPTFVASLSFNYLLKSPSLNIVTYEVPGLEHT